jgi:DNA-binding LacI/PurR family transcriptional regulator
VLLCLYVPLRQQAKDEHSTATVSRTINHAPTVAPDLAKRVWKAVEELGYYPNTQARALVRGKSRIFGLVVSEITNPFFPEIVQTFENLAVQHNYEILLASTGNDPKRTELSVRRMIERAVDGVAVMTFGMEEVLTDDLRFRSVPLVFVDAESKGATTIHIDYQRGIRQAVQHLAGLGHERIAFISGPLKKQSAVARKNAFDRSMKEIGKQTIAELIIEGDHTTDGGMRAFRQLSQLRDPATAVVCSNDMTAIGVMRQAYELGIAVPEELSVVGYDDIRMAQFMIPPLTTVQMSQTRLAEIAFRALLAKVEPEIYRQDANELLLSTDLVLRNSTSPPASAEVESGKSTRRQTAK